MSCLGECNIWIGAYLLSQMLRYDKNGSRKLGSTHRLADKSVGISVVSEDCYNAGLCLLLSHPQI